jgi:hypothetical protein
VVPTLFTVSKVLLRLDYIGIDFSWWYEYKKERAKGEKERTEKICSRGDIKNWTSSVCWIRYILLFFNVTIKTFNNF